ncbi:MAG TPA: glutathione S-transferase family protein [Sphingorhabdus sp.]|jgi:glutathione S-transferase|nr:glutathione S-transferase family protein [Sphingorhabdus sp.]
MKLFGAPVSPFVRKVLAYAAEKGIDLEMVPVGLGDPNPEFIAASPFKKMPAFSDGDFSISDSTAIITYLEAKFPEPALLPADPAERARTIWFEEFADTMISAAGGKVFFNRVIAPRFMGRDGDEEAAKAGEAELAPLFDYLENIMPSSGHLVGDRLTLADIAVASAFVNLAHVGIAPDTGTQPKLAAFVRSMHARPSFATWIPRERKMLGLTDM